MGIKKALWRQANFKQHSIAVKFFMKVEQKIMEIGSFGCSGAGAGARERVPLILMCLFSCLPPVQASFTLLYILYYANLVCVTQILHALN